MNTPTLVPPRPTHTPLVEPGLVSEKALGTASAGPRPGSVAAAPTEAPQPAVSTSDQVALTGAHMVEVLKVQKEALQLQNSAHQLAQQYQAQANRINQQMQQKQQAFATLLAKLQQEYGCAADGYAFDDDKMAFIKAPAK